MAQNSTADQQIVDIQLDSGSATVESGRGMSSRDLEGAAEGVFSRTALYLMSLLVVLVTVAGALTFYRESSLLQIPHGPAVQMALLGMLVGLVVAAVLLALGAVLGLQLQQLRALRGVHNSLDRLRGRVDDAHRDTAGRLALLDESLRNGSSLPMGVRAEPSLDTVEGSSTGPKDSAVSQQMVELLAQMRDFTLMNDQQRQVMQQQYWEKKKARLSEMARGHIQRREWRRAGECIDELLAAAPHDPVGQELTQQVATEKKAEVEQVVRNAQNQLGEWISIGAWDKVRELIGSLRHHYPDEHAVITLVERVRKEEHAARIDELQRLFSTLKEATEHRQWQRAWLCAKQLMERYPDEKVVERIRLDLPTLEQNARIQERKEDEAMFQDLLHRQRYEEALEVANRIVQKFPDSPAAAELTNRMIPKVQELARQDQLKRQQASGKGVA